jgi:serine/threonine protein kinase
VTYCEQLHFCLQLASLCAYLHDNDIVLSDWNLKNFMLCDYNVIKLTSLRSARANFNEDFTHKIKTGAADIKASFCVA